MIEACNYPSSVALSLTYDVTVLVWTSGRDELQNVRDRSTESRLGMLRHNSPRVLFTI